MTATLEEMAREAGYDVDLGLITMPVYHADGPADERENLARFAALVRAQARAEALEDAARVCSNIATDCESWDEGGFDGRTAANQCAAAIRALPAKP